ncbi:MAG TPA: hypothetical protein VN317_03395 [Candidatus Methanoperedens sp.]|nr:hypothetical protein [Candidatus Methanoperedens sp.]
MEQEPSQRPYEKPELTVIEFSAEEVLAVGCKTPLGGPSRFAPGCRLANCFQRGS